MSACGYMQRPKVSDALNLELQNVVSRLAWVLGTKSGPLEEQRELS